MEHKDVKFLETTVRALVDFPDAVRVERTVDEMGVLLSLYVDKTDLGRIIGREGSNAQALRSLLRIIGIKENSRVNLKIITE